MKHLFDTGLALQDFFHRQSWKFCFIGGVALQRWGQPRLTRDVDVSLLTGFGEEEKYMDLLLQSFRGRVERPREFALKNRVLLLKTDSGIGIDVALAGFPFEEEMIDRGSLYSFLPGYELRTCSGEDLLVMKAFAGRSQDWADLEGILQRSGRQLNMASVVALLEPLCALKGSIETLPRLQSLWKTLCPDPE